MGFFEVADQANEMKLILLLGLMNGGEQVKEDQSRLQPEVLSRVLYSYANPEVYGVIQAEVRRRSVTCFSRI